MVEAIIRPYQFADREVVLKIAADTAFFGEPVENHLDDRGLFNDAFYLYYTNLEPEHGWVACFDDDVVGFLLGSSNTKAQRRRFILSILPLVIRKMIMKQYRIGKKSIHFGTRLLYSSLIGEQVSVNLTIYPAHLHINISQNFRGQGIGKALMKIYLQQLIQENIPGVHLHTTNRNIEACHLYESLGFKLLKARSTHLWADWGQYLVENRCYGLRLSR